MENALYTKFVFFSASLVLFETFTTRYGHSDLKFEFSDQLQYIKHIISKKKRKLIKGALPTSIKSYFPHPFIGLAIFDNLCLISTFFQDGLHYWFVGTVIPMDNAYTVFWPITWPIYMFAFTGNASMTLLVCVERFIFVVYPFKSKIWCSKQRTLLYILVATVICFILTIPHFFVFTWDKNGKVRQADLLLKYGQIGGLSIPDELIRHSAV